MINPHNCNIETSKICKRSLQVLLKLSHASDFITDTNANTNVQPLIPFLTQIYTYNLNGKDQEQILRSINVNIIIVSLKSSLI